MSLKKRKIKFELRIKLNHNTYSVHNIPTKKNYLQLRNTDNSVKNGVIWKLKKWCNIYGQGFNLQPLVW